MRSFGTAQDQPRLKIGRFLRAPLLASIGVAALMSTAVAQIERQHQAHVHGEGTGSLAQDGQEWRLELTIPGINLVGFEHAPRNDDQQSAIDQALAYLEASDWLQADRRGQCEVRSIRVHTHGYKDDHDSDSDHGHGDVGDQHEEKHRAPEIKHEHKHDHGHRHGAHHDEGHHHDKQHDGHRHDDTPAEDHHGHGHEAQHRHHDHDDDAHYHDHEHAEFHLVAMIDCAQSDRLRWLQVDLFTDWPGNEQLGIDVLSDRVQQRVRLSPGAHRIVLSR